jgi:multicomponent K+:H+ antiporter subunit G
MSILAEVAISALLIIGAFFLFVGSFALVKLPDPMQRLHGPTKASTLGVGSVLIASVIYFPAFQSTLSIHELLITLFLLITAPITAHLLSKAYLHSNSKHDRLGKPESSSRNS